MGNSAHRAKVFSRVARHTSVASPRASSSRTSAIHCPMRVNSPQPKPRVVPTALESRTPDVMWGFSSSKGTVFLLQVSPACSSLSLAS